MPWGNARRNRRLIVSVAAFVLLDFGTLAFNFQIARQVEHDALAINLAGRQRMLSQRMTKAALMATLAEPGSAQYRAAHIEAMESWQLFHRTLDAFAEGGTTMSSRGEPVALKAVTGDAIPLVQHARELLQPVQNLTLDDVPALARFSSDHNRQLLTLMNDLTGELETQSVAAVFRLRIAQTMAFLLSLGNFFLILLEMQRTRRRAEHEAMTDALTGLHNRSSFMPALEREFAHSQCEHNPMAVLMIDLDHFKQINDRYGHAAGDDVLRSITATLRQHLRRNDLPCRIGGEEFVVILPGTSAQGAEIVAEKLRSQIAAQILQVAGEQLQVTTSIGVATRHATDPDHHNLLARADNALYAAKHAGRNCVRCAEEAEHH